MVLLRAWAAIDGFAPMEVFEQIHNTEKRVKWDTVTAGISTVETIDDTTDIIHFIIKVTKHIVSLFLQYNLDSFWNYRKRLFTT